MPNFKSGNFKQKNKPFKGGAKSKSEFKETPKAVERAAKKIQKQKSKPASNLKQVKGQEKANRRNTSQQRPKSVGFKDEDPLRFHTLIANS